MEKYQFSEAEKKLIESIQQPLVIYQYINKRVVSIAISDGFCELFGYTDRSEAHHDMDHDMYRYTHPDDTARISEAAIRFAKYDEPFDVVYRTRRNNCACYEMIHAIGKHYFTESGVRLAHVSYTDEGPYSQDGCISKSKLNTTISGVLHEESLVKASQFDYLTGLPSMTYFFELAELGKESIEKSGGVPAMLFMDLSGMKYFNSQYGFTEGDKLIQQFARLLAHTFNSENCCHISGDHFTVYTEQKGLSDRLNKFFDEWKTLNDGKTLPVRVGIYTNDLLNLPASIACDRAKFACDTIRNTFKSGFSYYDKNLSDEAERKQYVLTNLDRAIKEKWIKVYYQPIVRAFSGHVCDEEALARWIDPEKGFLSPGFFIPFLEESGLIYKLDIYMVEQVLEKMKYQLENGINIVPHSINFSRSDFEACDLVEEVRSRVDASGIPRKMITIEITESAVGNNFDFMKSQIERFQELGFPVWMDDFGSGYSSMDVLSSIKFDLIKFDMVFMKKFDVEESRKIILTELMRMATSLGVDTVCEGVETENQVVFLQEIGCAKLQGFYFSKPIPLEAIIEKYEKGIQIGYENPDDAKYCEIMGRVNLYDLSAIASDDDGSLNHFFNMLPIGIIEMQDDSVRFVRSNPSYRSFIKRFFNFDMNYASVNFAKTSKISGFNYINFLRDCCKSGTRLVYDEQMPDGSIVHSLGKKIAYDPVRNRTAIAVAVLSISEPDKGATYASIARALAADYYNIYYVDLKTDKFIEYSSTVGVEELAVERHGEKFFETARRDTMKRIYEEDRAPFLTGFTKKNILNELDQNGSFTFTYRIIDFGEPTYVNMKIMRMNPDRNHIIIGISVIDSQMKQQELHDAIQREEMAYSRIMALSGSYLSLYTVDPETNGYYQYVSADGYNKLNLNRNGIDFFNDGIRECRKVIYDEDIDLFIDNFKKEKILVDIKENGAFMLKYRIIMENEIVPVLLKIVPITERNKEKLIVGIRRWKTR